MISEAHGQSIELKHNTQNGNHCQAKIVRMTTSFEERLLGLFGLNLKEIAEKLGVNYHTFRNWAKETRDIPPSELAKIAKMTNVSLNWLLLGEGEKYQSPAATPDLIDVLNSHLRRIIREEIAASSQAKDSVQELGSVDEFLADSVSRFDDASTVLMLWYAHDHLPVPELSPVSFSGWADMTLEQKVRQIKFIRESLEEEKEFEERSKNAPKTTRHS